MTVDASIVKCEGSCLNQVTLLEPWSGVLQNVQATGAAACRVFVRLWHMTYLGACA